MSPAKRKAPTASRGRTAKSLKEQSADSPKPHGDKLGNALRRAASQPAGKGKKR
jgi:hypothetical protein